MAAIVVTQAGGAFGYCRATTCAGENDDYCAVGDNGCIIDGLPLAWPQGATLDFILDGDSAKEAEVFGAGPALENAIDAWSEVRCGNDPPRIELRYVPEGDAPDGAATIDVVFVSSGWPYANDAIGRTELEFYDDTGLMSVATILLNSQHYVLSRNPDENEIDLTAVLTHEIGHVIALAHSSIEGSTMESETTAQFATQIRTLAHDDEEGICALYPPETDTVVFNLGDGGEGGEGGSGMEEPKGGKCSQAPVSGGGSSWLFGSAVALGLVALRRRAGGA